MNVTPRHSFRAHEWQVNLANAAPRASAQSHCTKGSPVYPRPRRYLWYPVMIVLLLFALKDPSGAGYLAHGIWDGLSGAADALSKLVGS